MNKNIVGMMAAGVVSAGVFCGVTGCRSWFSNNSPYGSWALELPYETMNAGHLILEKDAHNRPKALLLWRWASPTDGGLVRVKDNTFSVTRAYKKPKDHENDPARWRALRVSGVVHGDEATCSFVTVDGFGKPVDEPKAFTGTRNPPIGAAPDLSKAQFGESVNLLAGSIADFELMENDKLNGWKLENGVLSNRIARDKNGKSLHKNGNLRTKRADFYDFNLKYDVRVLPACNSGVYLRGIYEIQVVDSYGKPADCHNMAAYYGRVTPSATAEKPAGEWQSVDVTLWKRHLTVVLNGVKIIDNVPVTGITGGAMTSNEFVPGPLYLQGDHSDADFRNMVLTPINN